MHALKWWKASTRMFFEGEPAGGSPSSSDGGSGSGSASPASPAPSSGDGGGSGSSPPASDGGDGASSPTASPSSSDPNEVDWSMLGSPDDLDSIEIPPVAPPPPAAPAAPKPTAHPPATPTPQQAQPEAPLAAPPAATAPAQPAPQEAQPPVVQLSPSDPLGIATALEQNRDASIAHLAQSRFALSQEDIAELEDNAATFVPKMMARVHHEAQISMMKFLAQAVPGMMKQFQTVQTANTEAEDQFFSAHKALGLDKTNKQHRETAFRIASIYRRANPQMPMEQLIADVGPMVAMSLKLPMVPQSPAAVPGSPQPVAARSTPTGFRPAVNGGGGASPSPEPENEWAGLGREYD